MTHLPRQCRCGHGRVADGLVGIGRTAEERAGDDGQTRIGKLYGVTLVDSIVIVEPRLILCHHPVPLVIGGSKEQVAAVLVVDESILVEYGIVEHSHGVEVYYQTILNASGNALVGVKLVDAVLVEEVIYAVHIPVKAKILIDIGEILHLLVKGEQHAITVKVVGTAELRVAKH